MFVAHRIQLPSPKPSSAAVQLPPLHAIVPSRNAWVVPRPSDTYAPHSFDRCRCCPPSPASPPSSSSSESKRLVPNQRATVIT